MTRRIAAGLLWLALAVSVAAGVSALSGAGGPDVLDAAVAQWRAWLAVARLAAIGALWWWWDRLVGRVAGMGPAARYLRGRRHFYAGCLVAVELLIVQNVAAGLWDMLAGRS